MGGVRRHPLYSTRLTLRTAAVTALALVAAIGAIVASANLTFALQAVILVACALALMFIIQAVSTPKTAKLTVALPPSAKLVHNHRRKIYKWTEFFAILAVFLGVMAMLLRGEARAANGGSRGRLAGAG
jgi:hypothetical protein